MTRSRHPDDMTVREWSHTEGLQTVAGLRLGVTRVQTRRQTPGAAVAIACTPKPRNTTPETRVTHSACRR
jgi:hypothetical protein